MKMDNPKRPIPPERYNAFLNAALQTGRPPRQEYIQDMHYNPTPVSNFPDITSAVLNYTEGDERFGTYFGGEKVVVELEIKLKND